MEGLEKGVMYETRSHWSGALPADRLFPMVFHPDGTKAGPYKEYQVKDLYDGLVYIGPLTDWLFPSADVYQDDEYRTELNRRSTITRVKPMEEELKRRLRMIAKPSCDIARQDRSAYSQNRRPGVK